MLFPGGDGFLYSFRADRGKSGRGKLLWKFDCNPKRSLWSGGGVGDRNYLVATPVVHDGLVYIAVGQDPDHGEGDGHLWCIDPTRRGDVSAELAVANTRGQWEVMPHRARQAVDPSKQERAISNPNSAVVWHYDRHDQDGDGTFRFEETMHRTIAMASLADDLLYIADLSGIVHCLDAKGDGRGNARVHFSYDLQATTWGSPLIAGGHVYIADTDGDVTVFRLGSDQSTPVDVINMGDSMYGTPVAAGGTLYVHTRSMLYAISESTAAKP